MSSQSSLDVLPEHSFQQLVSKITAVLVVPLERNDKKNKGSVGTSISHEVNILIFKLLHYNV